MTRYIVQFELPVDNPEKNVRIRRSQQGVTFFVPLNHPDLLTMTYPDLVAAAELSGLLHLSTPLNTNTLTSDLVSSNASSAVKKAKR